MKANRTSELKSALIASPRTLLVITAEWCGHCKILAPEMETVERYLLRNTHQTGLQRVDEAEIDREFCKQMGVTGYPSILLVSHGSVVHVFKGPRNAAAIINFAVATSIF